MPGSSKATLMIPPSNSVRSNRRPFPGEWQQLDGFKLEADWVGDRAVCSVSLTDLQKRDEIDEVAKGKRAIGKLFSSDQERFLS